MRHSSALAILALTLASAPVARSQIVEPALEAPAAPPASTLVFSFPGLRQTSGVIMVALFDSPEAWAKGPPTRAARASAADPVPTVRFEDLPPGTYAARAFQDLDGDGKVGANPFGLPTEPYGFTNGAKASMGLPRFEAAALPVGPGQTELSIALR